MRLWQTFTRRRTRISPRSRAGLSIESLEIRRVMAANPLFPLERTFLLDSLPTATKTIFLDFTGHRTRGSAWNYDPPDPSGTPPLWWTEKDQEIVCAPFTLDASFAFSNDELTFIQDVWARVAEDYAPFQVNVTTREPALDLVVTNPWFSRVEKPSGANAPFVQNSSLLLRQSPSDTRWGVRVVISDASRDGDENPADGKGGLALGGSFGGIQGTEAPCFVNISGTQKVAKYVAEAASHEAGHTLGLDHDGMASGGTSGNTNLDYYPGHGSGQTSWGTIMGVSYDQNISQWSKGEYASASNFEDDLAVLSNPAGVGGFTYRADDRGDTMAKATRLTRPLGQTVQTAAGIIERNTDADMYAFTVSTGNVDLWIKPLSTVDPTNFSGANLDVGAVLYNAAGAVVAEMRPENRLDARWVGSLVGGNYFVKVFGTGNGEPLTTGYSNYGSLGQYTVSVSQTAPPATSLPLVSVSGPGSVTEGTTTGVTVRFTVRLSKASTQAVTVAYATKDGTATVFGGDYVETKGTLTFAPGETVKTVPVSVIGDAVAEANETFVLELSSPTNATLGQSEAIVTLINDDRGVAAAIIASVSSPTGTVTKGDEAEFEISLASAATKTVTLYFRTVSGTALGGRDFVVKTGSVTIGLGQTKATVRVQTRLSATSLGRFSLELMPQPGVTFTTRIANVQIL